MRVWARGGVRPVLALHCSLAHAGAWAGLAERLAGVTISALDLPGHGKADDWDGRQDYHGLATRVAMAAADQLGGPVDVLGHSFGGTVALRMALERPDLVRSLTLVEPVLFAAAQAAESPAYPAFLAEHRQVAALMQAGDAAGAARLFHAIWGAGEGLDDLPERQRRYIIARMPLVMAPNPALMMDTAGMLGYGRLEGLGLPVLLAQGADSPAIVAAIGDELARRLPQVRRVEVAGAGHMLPISHAPALAPHVQAHLDGC